MKTKRPAFAATRYSGTYTGSDGQTLPAVRLWLAWNEPNNPVFLWPQYRRVKGKWVIESAIDYAKICTAVYEGVHSTLLAGEQVACGATAPRGNNNPASSRPSVSPLAFLSALKRAGLKTFDAYAHHPYYGSPRESPTTLPSGPPGAAATAVTLANIGALISELTKLYGKKPLWITEHGYQTNPPDRLYGVSWALQAKYLTQAYAIARRNPRITMMLWFLLQDEPVSAAGSPASSPRRARRSPPLTPSAGCRGEQGWATHPEGRPGSALCGSQSIAALKRAAGFSSELHSTSRARRDIRRS